MLLLITLNIDGYVGFASYFEELTQITSRMCLLITLECLNIKYTVVVCTLAMCVSP